MILFWSHVLSVFEGADGLVWVGEGIIIGKHYCVEIW